MRVRAIKSLKNGVCYDFGEGELIENSVPDISPFNRVNITNPCIKLDTGKYVWGFECWWGEAEKFNQTYADKIKEVIMVEPKNIQPLIIN